MQIPETQENCRMINDSRSTSRKQILSSENAILLLIMSFAVFFRLLTVVNINTSGDEASIWLYAKKLYYGLPYVSNHWSHHAARFGMIIPVYLVQLLIGTHPDVYFVTPLLFFFIQLFFLYRVGVRSHGISAAFLGSLLLITFPQMFQHAVQIRPESFCATYTIISVYLLFLYGDSEKHPVSFLILSAIFMFLSYMAKITSIFFIPGSLIAIWVLRKRFSHALLYGAVLFFFFIIETALYYSFNGFPLGRLSIIMGSHLQNKNLHPLLSFWDLFGRYGEMTLYWKIYFSLYLLSAGFLIALARRILSNRKILSVLLISSSFFFFITFAISSIDPLIPAMSYNHRHFVLVSPLMMLVIAYAAIELFNLGKERSVFIMHLRDMPLLRRVQPVTRYALLTILLAIFCLSAYITVIPLFPKYARKSFFLDHPFWQTYIYHRLLNNAYKKGTPIVERKVVPDRFLKSVEPVQALIRKGYSLERACREAGVDERYYRYSLKRVKDGDYKTLKIFTHIFWDGNFISIGKISLPRIKKTTIKGIELGYIVRDEFFWKNGDPLTSNNMDILVLEMTEKPFNVYQEKLKDLLSNKPEIALSH
jgi:hypothetical protein